MRSASRFGIRRLSADSHRLASDLIGRAELALRDGDEQAARSLFAEAAQKEVQALRTIPRGRHRTRAIIAVSAVSLSIRAGKNREAADIALQALADADLPADAREDMLVLLRESGDQRQLPAQDGVIVVREPARPADRLTFADNQQGNTIAEAIRRFAQYSGNRWPLSIASGYFDLGGFSVIADILEAAPATRILLGVEPSPPRALRQHENLRVNAEGVGTGLRQLEEALIVERDLMPFDATTERQIERLLAFLHRPTTEVRIYRERFLHGKAFVFGHEASVIAGSANFTAAGLLHNLELDLGQYEPDRVVHVAHWFEELWASAERFDLAGVFAAREETFDPYTVYLRMLLELYGDEPELADEEDRDVPAGALRLASFQRLGVLRAKRILAKYNGVLIADGVGLGKTFIAGDLLRSAIHEEGIRTLLVTPAALRDSVWDGFLTKHQLGVENLSYQELAMDSQVGDQPRAGEPDRRKGHLGARASEYRLIVVDEAHAFRNPDTLHYKALRRLVAAGATQKRLVLLTATPVNNSLWDLYHQIMLFARQEAAFAELGIPSLYELFAFAHRTDPDDLTPHTLFPVLDAISVRRTRHHIKRYYADEFLPGDPPRRIRFPDPRLRSCRYTLGAALPGFFSDVAKAIEERLTMAVYTPDEFRTTAVPTGRQQVLAGLLRSQLLKRFESSLGAFRSTLARLIAAHDRFLGALDRGSVLIRDVDADEIDGELDEEVLDVVTAAGEAKPAELYDVQPLRASAIADRALLVDLLRRAANIQPSADPKLRRLLELLRETGADPDLDRRKVVLFSYFADTVDYVKQYLDTVSANGHSNGLGPYAGRYVEVTGASSSERRRNLVWNFVPKSSEAPVGTPDQYDLMLATDALAEGQNLQQAGKVINFDLPWNPMRIVQRNGRVDRIGSEHETVSLYSFFPEAELDDLLGLERRLRQKIAQANAAVGVETPPIPGTRGRDVTFADTEEAIRAIAEEDESVLEREEGKVDAFSGELLREELRRALLAGRGGELRRLPWGAGSGHRVQGRSHVVFATRVGTERLWRSVALQGDSVERDQLAMLAMARCAPGTQRFLPDETRERLFALWSLARETVYEDYNASLDPLNRQAPVPRAQLDAVTLLQGVTIAGAADAIRALQVPWPLTIARALRRLLHALDRPDADAEAVARQLIELVRDEGLRPPVPRPAPLRVDPSDIHLVCFQVVSS